MASLGDAFATTATEDIPLNQTQTYTSAGELRLFGFTHIPYETFIIILVIVAIAFTTLKIVLKKHYREKGIFSDKNQK